MYPLSLHAEPGAWRLQNARKADPAFRAFQAKIFLRDEYTCQFCGFRANDFQEVVNVNHNYKNNKLSNMATACCFCAQCLFLESVGIGNFGGGTLIHLPEISQANLNSFCHVLFCAITNDTGYKSSAQAIYRGLKFRANSVEAQFGEGSSNPSLFGQLMIEAKESGLEINDDILAQVRLLPSRAKFRKQIEHWAVSALDDLSK